MFDHVRHLVELLKVESLAGYHEQEDATI